MPLPATSARCSDRSRTRFLAVTSPPSPSGGPDDQPSEGKKLDRILVPVDSSATSEPAIRFAVQLASEHQSEVLFVDVTPTFDTAADASNGPTEHDQAQLGRAAALAREQGVDTTTHVVVGPAAAAILAYAQSHDVNMIVVGSGADGALLGRLPLGVLRASQWPLWIVDGDGSVTYCGSGSCREVRIYGRTGTVEPSAAARSRVPETGRGGEAFTTLTDRHHARVRSRPRDAGARPSDTRPAPPPASPGRASARRASERTAGMFPALLGLLSGAVRLESVVFVGHDSWAITATIPYEGVMMVAEFASRASASEWFALADTLVRS